MLISLAGKLPNSVKRPLRRLMRGTTNPYFPGVKRAANVSDLYFWIADGEIDTTLLLDNFFSRFFPDLDTRTETNIEFFDADGRLVAKCRQELGQMATPVLWASKVLKEAGCELVGTPKGYGNVIWYTRIPDAVRSRMAELDEDMLFWDRGYIGYIGPRQQVAFIHGVDKAAVTVQQNQRRPWMIRPEHRYVASPEIPVEFSEYTELDLIVQNRDRNERVIDMTVSDSAGRNKSWTARVPAMGVHRFHLEPKDLSALDGSTPMRLNVSGLPTRFGRPVAFKRFSGGQFSLMHC